MFTTFSGEVFGGCCRHGYNNNCVVKVRGCSKEIGLLKETNVDGVRKTAEQSL